MSANKRQTYDTIVIARRVVSERAQKLKKERKEKSGLECFCINTV